ncbi:MAG TPA: sugar ABC transporter permease [Rhodobacteraceae bacterium]|jgi:capsular polysaccharide transport system permease protein|nr:sugar ABC transporter permease [Paracoccaceae bacterium]
MRVKFQFKLPRFARVIFALIMREMATSYGRSALGYLWAILEPIGAIAMLSLAFSIALSTPAIGESFPLFYATGYLPFMLYNTMQAKIGVALRENTQLLFYPRVTYMDAIISRFILVFLTQILVAVIVLWGIFQISSVTTQFDFAAIFFAFMAAAFLGLGIGVLNCVLIHLLPSWRQLWSIITRPIFIISCIFYLFDALPAWVQNILWYNPLVHIIGQTRKGFYSSYDGNYVQLGYPIFIGAITLFLGLALLQRHAKDLINT